MLQARRALFPQFAQNVAAVAPGELKVRMMWRYYKSGPLGLQWKRGDWHSTPGFSGLRVPLLAPAQNWQRGVFNVGV